MSDNPDDPKAATKDAVMPMEQLQKASGGCGRFQWMVVAFLKAGNLPIAWSMMQMAFSGMVPDWWCLPSTDYPGNRSSFSTDGRQGNWSRDNVTFLACQIPGSGGKTCVGHVEFDDSVTTVATEWSLVCERKHLKALMMSVQMAGVFVGSLVAGQTSDAIGRRRTCYGALLWHVLTCVVAAFSVNWQMFMAMRALIGLSIGAFFVASFPYCFEFVNAKHRQMVACVPGWNTGVGLFAMMAWVMPHWSHLQIAVAVLTVPILLSWFCVPESARWLATKGRLQEAEQVVEHVARVNGRPKPHDTLQTLQHVALEEKEMGQGRRYTYLDIFRGWRMAVTTFICTFVWCSMSVSYYGISFGISALSGNFYLNMFLMVMMEIPIKFVISLVADRVGRRWTCSGLYALCALFSFGILVVEKTVSEDRKGSVITVLAIISIMCISLGWMVAATLTSELYPTVVRSLGYGASNTMARVGGIIAPLALNMDTAADVVRTYIVVGSVMAASSVLTLFLRETKGQGLQDSITINPKEQRETELPVWTVEGEKEKDGEKRRDGCGKEDEEKAKDVKETNGDAVELARPEAFSVRL